MIEDLVLGEGVRVLGEVHVGILVRAQEFLVVVLIKVVKLA